MARILRGVDLEVPARSLVCLMGRNGVGKTTALKSIVGLVRADSGSVTLDGKPLDGTKPDERARRGIVTFRRAATFSKPHRLGKPETLSRRSRRANGQVDRVLQLFPALKDMLQRKGGVLSRATAATRDRPCSPHRSQSATAR